VAALNVPAAERLDQIAVNLDRWRRLPDDLGARHVRVNIPEYRLRFVDHGIPTLQARVIVGAVHTPTPPFSDAITYVVFNPVLERAGRHRPARAGAAGSRRPGVPGIARLRGD
jgi:murein L,D-transpeptidase YcbB/YkuD